MILDSKFTTLNLFFGIMTIVPNFAAIQLLRNCKRMIVRIRNINQLLCVADILVGIILTICSSILLFSSSTEIIAIFYFIAFNILDYMSLLLNLFMAWDRLMFLKHHVKYLTWMSKRKTCLLAIIGAVVCTLMSTLPLLSESKVLMSFQVQKHFEILFYFTITIICIQTFMFVKDHKRRILALVPTSAIENSAIQMAKINRNMRSTFSVMILVFSTALINFPQFVSVSVAVHSDKILNSKDFYGINTTVRQLNHMLNPILIICCYKECRYLVMRFLSRCCDIDSLSENVETMRIDIFEIVTTDKRNLYAQDAGHLFDGVQTPISD